MNSVANGTINGLKVIFPDSMKHMPAANNTYSARLTNNFNVLNKLPLDVASVTTMNLS